MVFYRNNQNNNGFYQPAGTNLPPQQPMQQQQPQQQPHPVPQQFIQQLQQIPQNIPLPSLQSMLPLEESYIENILRLNKGRMCTVYMTFDKSSQWNSKIFKGIIEAAGRDHIILSDPNTDVRYLLLTIYLDYVTFDGEINYMPLFQALQPKS